MLGEIDRVEWTNRASSRGVDPAEAYSELESLRASHGGVITDEIVVDAARSDESVLHPLFTWDDTEAARLHRLSQARSVIRSLTVVYVDRPKQPVRTYEVVRRTSSSSAKDRTEYATVADALSDPVARERLIADAVRAAMQFRRRFQTLHELSRVFEAIDETVESLATS